MGGLPSTSGDPGAGGGILELLSLGLVSRLTHPRARRRRRSAAAHWADLLRLALPPQYTEHRSFFYRAADCPDAPDTKDQQCMRQQTCPEQAQSPPEVPDCPGSSGKAAGKHAEEEEACAEAGIPAWYPGSSEEAREEPGEPRRVTPAAAKEAFLRSGRVAERELPTKLERAAMAEVCRQLAELNSQLAERLDSLDVIVEGISGQVAAATQAKSLLGQQHGPGKDSAGRGLRSHRVEIQME